MKKQCCDLIIQKNELDFRNHWHHVWHRSWREFVFFGQVFIFDGEGVDRQGDQLEDRQESSDDSESERPTHLVQVKARHPRAILSNHDTENRDADSQADSCRQRKTVQFSQKGTNYETNTDMTDCMMQKRFNIFGTVSLTHNISH